MKKTLLYMVCMAVMTTAFTACGNDDDFTASIYDTSIPVVDPNATTYPFDQWVYDNFTKPYNVEIQYQFDLPASDHSFQLVPAEYKRSQVLAHFIRYLFYDVYTKYAGEDFMRQYGPRIFHFIGSSGYNPNKGTEVLGTASGGVKITLYKINNLKGYVPGSTVYGGEDMDELNQNYFHTMHHEFSHIQHQTKPYPITYGQITSSTYDPVDWGDRDSLASHTMGYVTQYGSSANYEDFVETLSCIITDSDLRWMRRIIRATIPGFRAGDKEDILELVANLGIDANKAGAEWTKFSIYDEKKYDVELGTYQPTNRVGIQQDVDDHSPVPWSNYINKVHDPNKGKYVDEYQYTLKKSFNSFAEFLDWVPIKTDDSITGINSLLKKISIATAWHKEKWGLNTFTLRKEVAARQKNINSYLSSEVTIYDYK